MRYFWYRQKDFDKPPQGVPVDTLRRTEAQLFSQKVYFLLRVPHFTEVRGSPKVTGKTHLPWCDS